MNRTCHVSHSCPQCAGEVVFDQEATGTRCRFCGAGLVVAGGRSAWLNFLIRPAVAVPDTAREIQRIAARSGWKPVHLRSVLPFHFPFYRTVGYAVLWARGQRREGAPGAEVEAEEVQSRAVDVMRPAHRDLSSGLFTPGVRAQAMRLHLATRENAGSTPFLPVQVDRNEYLRAVEPDFFSGIEVRGLRVMEERRFRIWQRHSVVHFPMALAEIREGGSIRLLLLDMVGGALVRQIGHREMEVLLDNLGLKGDRSPGESRLRLLPLICPECAGDLDDDSLAAVRFCRTCRRGWETRQGRLRERPCRHAAPPPGSGETAVYLPFWRRGREGARDRFIPAFGVRSPQLLYNLSNRYYSAAFAAAPVSEPLPAGARVLPAQIPAEQADEMATLVTQTSLVRPPPARGSRLSLLLVPFARRGTDYVDHVHGLAVPSSAVETAVRP